MKLSNLAKLIGSATLLATPLTLLAAEDHPVYRPQATELFIPSIDTAEMQGAYHNVALEFVRDDLWRLKHISYGSNIPGVEKVRVIKTDSFPVQVFLEVEGWISGCGKLDIGKRLVGDTFEVAIQWAYPRPITFACAAVVNQFSWIVPLDVYGLAAGEYKYIVNGGVAAPVTYLDGGGIVEAPGGLKGSFVLASDNKFNRSAPEYPRPISFPTAEVQMTRGLHSSP